MQVTNRPAHTATQNNPLVRACHAHAAMRAKRAAF